MHFSELIPSPARSWLRQKRKQRPSVIWAQLGRISEFLAQKYAPLQPPVLIISTPRSGSTWVGETLAESEHAMYLHEPLSLSYQDTYGSRGTMFEVDSETLPEVYVSAAHAAFAGIPKFHRDIVPQPASWQLSTRPAKRIVVKEVNPLMLSWLLKITQPRVVYLVRHPAAVANSYTSMGWGWNFHKIFRSKTLSSGQFPWQDYAATNWSRAGAIQAMICLQTLEALRDYPHLMILKYEHICQDPTTVFREVFDFCELPFTPKIQDIILQRSASDAGQASNPYATRRRSVDLTHKWKTTMSDEAIDQVKTAFNAMNPPFYHCEEW